MTRPRSVTIADVAARAGVSTATVSRILAGVSTSRPETRRRVLDAVTELGYRPSALARSLRTATTRTLGLVVTDIQNPFFPDLVRAVEDAAQARGWAVILGNGAEDPAREVRYLELLAEHRVDGLIVASDGIGRRFGPALAALGPPVVLLNCAIDEPALPAILSDNDMGARLAVGHLLELGHRRIGFLAGPPGIRSADERAAGARAAAAAVGDATLEVEGPATHVDDAVSAAGALLDREPTVTAIAAHNDLAAIGAMTAVRRRGRSVPGDVSVVGFDGIAVSAHLEPPLTTVVQDTATMGRLAVETILALVAASQGASDAQGAIDAQGSIDAAVGIRRIPVTLVRRESSGPPPA